MGWEDQDRDEQGRWGSGGGGGGGSAISRPSSAYSPANPQGRDTLERFKRADGSFTPERQALHAEIKEEMIGDATPVDNPTTYVMGGMPASGKSSMIGKLEDFPENRVTADPDHIKTRLPEFRESNAFDKSTTVHEESSVVGKQLAREAIAGGYNTVIDGTGDGSFEGMTEKVAGYRRANPEAPVKANYAIVDADEAVRRMYARGDKTGRYVPETYMRAVERSIRTDILPRAVEADLFDELTIWDNNGRTPSVMASKVKGQPLVVHDEAAWRKFTRGE